MICGPYTDKIAISGQNKRLISDISAILISHIQFYKGVYCHPELPIYTEHVSAMRNNEKMMLPSEDILDFKGFIYIQTFKVIIHPSL